LAVSDINNLFLMLFVLFIDFSVTAFDYLACIVIGYRYYILSVIFEYFLQGDDTSVTVTVAFAVL